MNMKRTHARLALAVAVSVSSLAHAESPGEPKPGTEHRVNGATTIMPMGDSLLIVGGRSLRRLPAGARRAEELLSLPGDSLYRVAFDDSGRVMAAWEKDASIRLLQPGKREPVSIPKPTAFPSTVPRMSLDGLAFAENGRDALVAMRGEVPGTNCEEVVHAVYRVPLDGKSPARLLFEAPGGHLLRLNPQGAIYAVGKIGSRSCNRELGAILTFEVSDGGVKQTAVLGAEQLPHTMETAWLLRGSDREQLAVMVRFRLSQKRALVRWRWGDPKADILMLAQPAVSGPSGGSASIITPNGDFIDVSTRDEGDVLDIRRRSADGREQVTTLPALQHVDSGVHGVGVRPNGELWVHWGDHLALLADGKPPRSYSIESLIGRRIEWAGFDVYVSAPEESLWIGLERGSARNFARVRFKDVDARATAWAPKK